MIHQPNILLLVLDTQRADRLSCYGHAVETTPYLDRLAEEATKFKGAVAPAQWTTPTHASMFTGLYPSQHTLHQMGTVLPAEVATIAERLQQAGYFTAALSQNPLIGAVKNGLQRGFQHITNYNHLGAGLLTFHLNRPDMETTFAARSRQMVRFLLAELLGYSRQSSLHWLSPLLLPLWKRLLAFKGGSKSLNTRRLLDEAAQLLLAHNKGSAKQPVFVFVNLMGVHVPYDPPRQVLARFLANSLGQRPANWLLQQANEWQVDVCNWLDFQLPDEEHKAILDACYNAETAAQDAQIGHFLERLRAGGALDNTLLVVAADHGDHLGEKRRVNHAFGLYEELVRVPLLIRDPKGDLPAGREIAPFVSTRRVFHTIVTAAGVATTAESRLTLAQVDNHSPAEAQEAVFAEAPPLQWAVERIEKNCPDLVQVNGYHQATGAVYARGHKLIATGDRQELYAVDEDPAESVDLSEQMPQRVNELRGLLQNFTRQMVPVAKEESQPEEDAAVLRQLRALGYLE